MILNLATHKYNDFTLIEQNHYKRLRDFFVKCNPFYLILNSKENDKLNTYLCEEYSPKFQLQILGIKQVREPFLDIGYARIGDIIVI